MILLNYGVFTYNKGEILLYESLLVRCRRILRTNHEKSKKPESMRIRGVVGYAGLDKQEFVVPK